MAGSSDTSPHVIVQARAGTGKTTTLIEGLRLLQGGRSDLTPSSQQQAVWDAICLSRGKVSSICFVAFNKSIATELQRRVPPGVDAMTMHSLGYKAVQKALGRQEPNSYVVQDMICELTGRDIKDIRSNDPMLLKVTEDLVSLCKMNLIDDTHSTYSDKLTELWWAEQLDRLASHYEVDLNGSRERVFKLVPRVLERCKAPKGKITFDDMIWLPVALGLPVFQYDLLMVDEAQDLNRCQQALAKKAGKRLILVGDDRQAIYGFAGADSESLPRMARELNGGCSPPAMEADPNQRHCIQIPLTVTRRCGKAIVEEAKKIVPDFEAHETCCEGKISEMRYPVQERNGSKTELPWEQTYAASVAEGDMVLCRVNTPLVSQCSRFLKRGIRANIQGRDVGQGLISTVKKLKATSLIDLVAKLDDWQHKESAKEQAKRFPNEAKLIAITDRVDCLTCFTEGAGCVEDVIRRIEAVFTDDKNKPGVRLSSVHKAKGLEAKRVFILMPKGSGMPHPMAKSNWQLGQEMNLKYVAVTRAIEELIWVS